MLVTFHNDERGYRRWHRQYRNGFVFNHFGGSNPWDNLIHRRDCDHLWRSQDEGRRTAVRKVCSDDLAELETEADRLRGGRGGWKRCEDCR